MSTAYPGSIDNNLSLPQAIDLITPVKAEIVNELRGAIIAIENELGTNPSSQYSTVAQRLDQLTILANNCVQGGGGVGTLSGDANGASTSNKVTSITFGSKTLSLSSINDGEVLVRSGDNLVGSTSYLKKNVVRYTGINSTTSINILSSGHVSSIYNIGPYCKVNTAATTGTITVTITTDQGTIQCWSEQSIAIVGIIYLPTISLYSTGTSNITITFTLSNVTGTPSLEIGGIII